MGACPVRGRRLDSRKAAAMRKTLWVAAVVLAFSIPLALTARAQPQQEESVAAAARKAREQKKLAPKAKRVFTNDTLPEGPGAASTVGGQQAAAGEGGEAGTGGEKPAGEKKEDKAEEQWRARFAEARSKIAAAEKELEILKVELNRGQVQYYDDPNQALREQLERKDINDKRKAIEDKQKEVEKLRQALSNLEDELRRSGGSSSWAR